MYIIITLCRCLPNKNQFILLSEFECLLNFDLSAGRVLKGDIAFVANEGNHNVIICVFSDGINPKFAIFEGLIISYIID